MAIDPMIARGIDRVRMPDPLETAQTINALRTSKTQNALAQIQMEEAQRQAPIKAQQAKYDLNDKHEKAARAAATIIYMNPGRHREVLSKLQQLTGEDETDTIAELDAMDEAGRKEWAQSYMVTPEDVLPKAAKQTDDIQEFEYAKKNGFGGSFADWMKQKAAKAGGAESSYFTPVSTSQGIGSFNNRAGTFELLGGPNGAYLPPAIDPRAQGTVADAKAAGSAQGEVRGKAAANLPSTLSTAQYSMDVIDKLLAHPGREMMTGKSSILMMDKIPGTDARDARALHDQVTGQAFLQAFETLKGGGQITETEGQKATQAIARLSTAQTDEAYADALRELKVILKKGVENSKRRAGAESTVAPATPAPPASGVKFLGFE